MMESNLVIWCVAICHHYRNTVRHYYQSSNMYTFPTGANVCKTESLCYFQFNKGVVWVKNNRIPITKKINVPSKNIFRCIHNFFTYKYNFFRFLFRSYLLCAKDFDVFENYSLIQKSPTPFMYTMNTNGRYGFFQFLLPRF